MIRKEDLLNQVHVEKPCPANWDEMEGDSGRRFCGQCRHHVHNLSEMTSAEAEALLADRTERLCVRYVKDAAGQVITRDRRPRKLPWWGRLALAASALMTVFGFQQPSRPAVEQGDVAAPKPPSKTRQILGRIAIAKPLQGKPVAPAPLQGEVAVPVPTTGIVAPPNHPAKPPVKVVKKKKPVKKVVNAKVPTIPKPVVKPKPKP